jgi:DNA-binding beta-propeller fold protein YncE
MNEQRISRGLAVFILAATIILGPAGCTREIDKAQPPRPDIVWPPAPEIPRIRFVNAVSNPQDLHISRGVFKKFFDYLAGKTAVSMVAPYSVETDSAGRLYTVDTFLRTVLVFDVKDNAYYPFSSDTSKLMSPIDLAIDENRGTTYVSDSQGGVVNIFHDRGKKWAGEIGKDVLQRPTGIAVNPDTSELIVVDTKLANIFRYDLKDHRLKGTFGGRGSADGQMNYPTNVTIGGDGNIFITDALNFRIQVFSSEGKFLKKFGRAGDNPGYFARPRGVALDSDGNIYVVDGLFDNIQIFDKDFRLLMAFGGPGNGYGQFWLPAGIYIDPNDTIYISDNYNKRVQIFQYLKGDAAAK